MKKKPEIAEIVKKINEKAKIERNSHALSGMAGRKDTSIVLKNFSKNVLIIVGENDIITPVKIAKQMISIVPKATFQIIPSVEHLSNIENVEEFNKKLLAWYKSLIIALGK